MPAEDQRPPPTPAAQVLEKFELLISRLLLVGVVGSIATILLGVVLTFIHHPQYLESTADLARLTTPGVAVPHRLGDVLRGVLAGRGQAVVALGLLLLIATPILRVAVSVIGFALARPHVYIDYGRGIGGALVFLPAGQSGLNVAAPTAFLAQPFTAGNRIASPFRLSPL